MRIPKLSRLSLPQVVLVGALGVAAASWLHRPAPPSEAPAYADLQAGYAPAASDARPGELVVDFHDDVGADTVRAIGSRLGVRFHASSDWTRHDGIYVGEVDPARQAAVLASLRGDARVEAAEENFVYSLPEGLLDEHHDQADPARDDRGFPDDPRFGEQWHLRQAHVPAAWKSATGEGVTVAVIDTGVAHVEDLAQTAFVPGWNFVNNTADSDDDHGHGTHVAGTIAQSTNNGIGVAGIAYKAKIMPLKVLSARGSGSVAGIADAIRWAADHGAQVINMSLGGRMNSQVLAKAVRYAHDHGVTVICAAGNDGQGRVSYPAANTGAVAVAATQQDEHTTFYSNWGPQIALAAPGGNTRQSAAGGVLQNTRFQGKEGYYFFMGTSMAAPHVAGVAALVVSQGVTDPDAVLAVLRDTARPPEGVSRDGDFTAHYGAGLLDAAAAVHKAQLAPGARELAMATLIGLGLCLALRRAGLLVDFGAGGILGLIVGGSGLFFLPRLLGLIGLGWFGGVPGLALLSRGFPAWDGVLFGASAHGNPLFYSALAPFVLVALLYGFRRLRGLLAGFALGVAGHLLATAIHPTVDVRYVPLDALWLAGNGLFAAVLGGLILKK